MKLTSVGIANFRSIEELRIEFVHGCQVLIGINESGKSNILKAIQLIDQTTVTTAGDLRVERKDDLDVGEGNVTFQFLLTKKEMESIESKAIEAVNKGSRGEIFCKHNGTPLTAAEFIASRNYGVYEVAIPGDSRRSKYFSLIDGAHQIAKGWAFNKSDTDVVGVEDGKPFLMAPRSFAKFVEVPQLAGVVPAQPEQLNEVIGPFVSAFIEKHLPKCIFWKYSDQYLLPSTVNVPNFVANPDACIPLRSMFELAGYTGAAIGASIEKSKAASNHRYFQLLRRVETAATKHLRDVWKDHKDVRIELQPNGDLLHPLIVDESVPLDMASRSDGFKRLVSFLLQISAKARSNELKDVLLLVDEPEIGLHPGGARNLTQELIKIGLTNTVVYSTHSIFMIDQSEIGRHLIVEKRNEVTRIVRAEKSKIQDEEVLYAAVGYSIFETVKRNNLIFEGWKDKEIFRIASDAMGKTDKALKDALSGIGLTFSEGVKEIKQISSFLELANRNCLILSDADKAALDKKKQYTKIGAWGKWITLKDVLGNDSGVFTGEDLILRDSVIKRANKWRASVPALENLTLEHFGTKSTMSCLYDWIKSAGIEGDALDEKMHGLKDTLFTALKREDLSDRVDELVKYVLQYDFGAK
ncbi:MAG: AAA family ATPase [Polaromonas sp.]|nr:AAA family ATPase [Polaromonas sp.]